MPFASYSFLAATIDYLLQRFVWGQVILINQNFRVSSGKLFFWGWEAKLFLDLFLFKNFS
jgi:hypothetical protein